MRLRALSSVIAVGAFFTASPARGQMGLDAFLGNVTDIGIYYGYGLLSPKTHEISSRDGFSSIGFELSFAVGARTRPSPGTLPEYAQARDTTWLFEFGLGYNQVSGFGAGDPKLELRGSVREIPMISVYATDERPWGWFGLSRYLGVRSGLLQLHDIHVFADTAVASAATPVSSNEYSAAGSAFLAGIAGGLVKELGPWNIITELAYSWRNFSSIDWNAGGKPIPKNLPHGLNLSGFSATVGVQIAIKAPKKGD